MLKQRMVKKLLSPLQKWRTAQVFLLFVISNWTRCLQVTSPSLVMWWLCSGSVGSALFRAKFFFKLCVLLRKQVSISELVLFTILVLLHSMDFSKPVRSASTCYRVQLEPVKSGKAQIVLSWWDIDMDPSGTINCTMAPYWVKPMSAFQVKYWALRYHNQMTFSNYLKFLLGILNSCLVNSIGTLLIFYVLEGDKS